MVRILSQAKKPALAAAALALCACTQSAVRLSPDFGAALEQDKAAQIADPDAHYTGTPAPGSNGARVELAQHRYVTGTVIQPSTISAASPASVGGFDNGANGAPPGMNGAGGVAASASAPSSGGP